MIAGFGESDIYITNSLAAKVGVRAEHSELLNKWNAAPRASLAYQISKYSSAGFAYGIFYQNPERKYLPTGTLLNFSCRTLYFTIPDVNRRTNITYGIIFYKKYDDLYKTGYNSNGQR